MKSFCHIGTLLGVIAALVHAETAAPSPRFHLPEGFEIEQVAGPEQLSYGMCATFDDRGRLFVTESSGSNEPGPQLVESPRCRIRLLEDLDGDGRFESSKVFADKLSLPMGVLFHQGSLFVASAPDLLRLDDIDGDGVADRRTVLLTGWNILNTSSLHGPYLHPDGWLYMTHGRHGYNIKTREGETIEGLASRIYRCRTDGSGLERICGGGFDNPVELAFSPGGEIFSTMTYIIDPAQDMNPLGTRDALIHVVEGGVFPKKHECIAEFKRTGELLTPMVNFARVAPAGFLRCKSSSWGEEYQGGYFSVQFNAHAIRFHRLVPNGASYMATDEDFFSCDDPNFHPADVLEDADGSLFVIDTGGWYLQACPLSRVAQLDARGGIYRIRRKGTSPVEDSRGLSLNFDTLSLAERVRLLEDSRFVVRDQAVERLVQAGGEAVEPLRQLYRSSESAQARLHAVWCLSRISTESAQSGVRAALEDDDADVRVAAAHAIGLHRDKEAVAALIQILLDDSSGRVQRECATALGRLADASASTALFKVLGREPDRFLEHAIIYALFNCAKQSEFLAALEQEEVPAVKQAALLALEQFHREALPADKVFPLLRIGHSALRDNALWVVGRHPEWADRFATHLADWLRDPSVTETADDALKNLTLALVANQKIQAIVAELLDDANTPTRHVITLLDVVASFPGEKLPEAWSESLGRKLKGPRLEICSDAIAAIRARSLTEFDVRLLQIAGDLLVDPDLRLSALAACIPRLAQVEALYFDLLIANLQPSASPLQRILAAQTVAKAKLTDDQYARLLDDLSASDPLTSGMLLEAAARSRSAKVGSRMVRKMMEFTEPIPKQRLDALLASFPGSVKEEAKPLYEASAEIDAAQARIFQEFLPLLESGDARRGRAIFFSSSASCSACHQVGSEGRHVGPDLTRIGLVRTGRDILESILFPSVSFAQGYEPHLIETEDGEVASGVVIRQTGDAVVLRSAGGTDVRIDRSSIKSLRASAVSVMPQGLETAMTREQLRDLLAYLQSLK